MLISEVDLYKREWLSLVFENRNQQYGAYQLRRRYANVLSGAMAVTFFTVAALGITTTIIARNKTVPAYPVFTVVHVDNTVHVASVHPPADKPQKSSPAKAVPKTAPVATQQYIAMKPVPDELVKTEVKPLNASMPVGQTEVKGNPTEAMNTLPSELTEGTPDGTGSGKPDDDGLRTADQIQVMPEPVGGEGAWAKFLQKNLRYPKMAQEANVQGRIFMSFIVEKDGHLSNIMVVRKAGYGFDEESIRVLKLAPAWKPGIQNGNPVRVRYTIPLNFQMTD